MITTINEFKIINNITEHDQHSFLDEDMYEIIWLILNAYDEIPEAQYKIEEFFAKYNVNNGQDTDDVVRDCIKSDMAVSDAEKFAISIGIDINVDLDEANTTPIKETMLGPGPDDRAIFYKGDIVLLYRTEEKATEERAKMRVQGAAVIDTPDKTHPYGVRIPVGHLVQYWYNNEVDRMSSFSNHLVIYNRKGEKINL